MVADLCEAMGADITDVAQGLGLDHRIAPEFLQAGIGFGGYCLPKDIRAFGAGSARKRRGFRDSGGKWKEQTGGASTSS